MSKRRIRAEASDAKTDLRIIGGRFRGRRIAYHGDPQTRPMKHRTREAIFNLISTASAGRHAIDLFAGTGALGLEALSRGAVGATFIEKHVPTARIVAENIAALGVEPQSTLLTTSAFLLGKRDLPKWAAQRHRPEIGTEPTNAESILANPWLVFCSPPYAFYVDRRADMLALIETVVRLAPDESVIVVEADDRFDCSQLTAETSGESGVAQWQIREYSPAVVGVLHKKSCRADA